MKKKMTVILALVIVLVLLAAVALAWGLTYSRNVTAARTARSAVMDKYGLSRDAMDMFFAKVESGDQETTVRFTSHDVYGEGFTQMGVYTVTITKDGSVTTQWSYDGVDPATWADGSLDAAVWGEKQILAYRAKRDQENLSRMSPIAVVDAPADETVSEASATPLPKTGKLTQEQALDIAASAMKETFGFSDETLALFDGRASLGEQEEGVWVVAYQPTFMSNMVLQTSETSPLGDYSIALSDETAGLLQAAWTLEGKEEKNHTKRTWGQASAYSAKMLPWALELVNTCAPLLENEAGEISGRPLNVEDNAAYDQAFRDAGFDGSIYNHVLPKAGDISYEEAVEIVARVLKEECGVSRAVFDVSEFAYADLTQEKDHREWYFWVQNFERQCGWTVVFNAETGEILQVLADPFANSNG